MYTNPEQMVWLNEPAWGMEAGAVWVKTEPDTDFWQRTHYGFQRDTAHALVEEVNGEFTVYGTFRFFPNAQYDQCGLYVRIDKSNWFKCSVEYEDDEHSRLGSVVTRGGYSDWASQVIASDVQAMSYRITFTRGDLIAAWSREGACYEEMRVAHLDTAGQSVWAGFYGCSPTGPGFRFEVRDFRIERS